MTKEDEAIEYAKKYACKGCLKNCKQINLLCGEVRYYMNAFKDDYEEGKKNEQCGKGHIESLQNLNERLETQIEKMKCCENCVSYDDPFCDSDHENVCKYFHNGGTDDYWQLKEE